MRKYDKKIERGENNNKNKIRFTLTHSFIRNMPGLLSPSKLTDKKIFEVL